jgi:hypothetical protein
MALIFTDPNTAGPFDSFQVKDVITKVVKLTNTNFSTTGVNTLVATLPADASIVEISYWNKTQLAGGSISAATMSIGATSGATTYASAFNVFTASGTYGFVSPVTGILQPYNPPMLATYPLWINGTSTTGNPTSGEIYVIIKYVR